MPSEIMYSDEAWDEYQERLKQSNLPPTEEQTFDGERFAQYLLDKVAREEWIAIRV